MGFSPTLKSGQRTVGSCSHSTAVMLFLSYGKYLDNLPQPGFRLNSFLVDAHLANEESEYNIESDLNTKQSPPSQLPNKSNVKSTQKRKQLTIIDINTPHDKIDKIIDIHETIMKTTQDAFENSVTFRSFSLKIPKWGGDIEVNVMN